MRSFGLVVFEKREKSNNCAHRTLDVEALLEQIASSAEVVPVVSNRKYFFTSVSVQRGGNEVVISNQEKSRNRLSKLLQNGKVAWINNKFSLHPTTQIQEPVPVNDSNRPT